MTRIAAMVLITTMVITRAECNSWEKAKETKKATLTLFWDQSVPFIYENEEGILVGVEYDILNLFKDYLKNKYQVDLQLDWVKAKTFYQTIENIQNADKPNLVGVAALSINDERKKIVNFTDSYLPDVTVLVSSKGTPIVNDLEEINLLMKDMVAITIKGTTYEKHLLNLQEKLDIDFEMRYITSDKNVLDEVSRTANSFAFMDLPIYLMWVAEGSTLVRQNFFTLLGTGYGLALPKKSDWDEPFNEFINDPSFRKGIGQIVAQHISPELYDFIGNIHEEVLLGTSILTKEKEIQLKLIEEANYRIENESKLIRWLVIGIVLTVFLLLALAFMLRRNKKYIRMLQEQRKKNERQRSDIEEMNEQLVNRNAKLRALNDEKNNLVSILAHDLRSPLGHILGMVNLMKLSEEKLGDEEKQYMNYIGESANHMNNMIVKILNKDVLEGKDSPTMIEEVEINTIVNDVADRFQTIAESKKIKLGVKNCAERCQIMTDQLLLFLILENLVSNAIKFSVSGKRVSLEVHCQKDEVIFQVSDEGPGFTSEDKLLLFNRFQPLSAKPTGGETSTGLGLSIVKKYVTDLHGNIWLESEVGKGSTFFVSLKH